MLPEQPSDKIFKYSYSGGHAMTTPEERAELMKELLRTKFKKTGTGLPCAYTEDVADFILAREAKLREENAKLKNMVEEALYLMTCFNMDCGRYKLREEWLASSRAIIATERTDDANR